MRNRAILIIGFGTLLTSISTATLNAQDPTTQVYASPRVSPYLNLGVSSSGLSTYPTLVRPMIDDQQAIARQSAEIDRLQRQVRGGRDVQARTAKPADARAAASSGRFMNFSHYYLSSSRETEVRPVRRN